MKNLLFYLSLIAIFPAFITNSNSQQFQKPEYSHYDIQLKIIPVEQFIKVSGSLQYIVNQDSLDELSFNLHKKFVINKFSINGDNIYQLDTSNMNVRWLPDAMRVVYSAKKKFHKGEILDVVFSYEGRITEWPEWSANVIGPDWTEIGLYFPWYPSIYDLFTYKVSVDIEPSYNVFAIGEYSEIENKKIFEANIPVNDFIICASRDLTIRETKLLNQSFKIVNSVLSESNVDLIQKDIENIYNLFSKWFGKIEVNNMCLVVSKRDKGGGYSRRGGLFLGGVIDSYYLDNRTDFIQYVAHEIAHFWWYGARSDWEDWLNESFAEYSAMNLIKELYGKDEFDKKLNTKTNESINTPPIWGISRNDPLAQPVLYAKGVVLLVELEEKIGKNKFLEICKERIDKKINNTPDLLNLIKDIGGKETADWFEQLLKNG